MIFVKGLSDCGQRFSTGTALTIGNFDGVHLGHQAILRKLVEMAAKKGLPSVLLTFQPHPVQVLFPERSLKRLFPPQDLDSQVDQLKVDALVVEPFTPALASLPAREFLEKHLVPGLHPKEIVVGHDFSFGSNREGNLQFLKEWCAGNAIGMTVQPPIEIGGERVSSRSIRELVMTGEMEKVRVFLNRPFYMEGIVEKGAGRGQTLGVPTINLNLQEFVAPRKGVYITTTEIGTKSYSSVSNLGVRPTFGDNADVKLETHILGFAGDLYGSVVKVKFHRFLRDERKFSSVDELRAQILRDIEAARQGASG